MSSYISPMAAVRGLLLAVVFATLPSVAPVAAQGLGGYREFTLGSSIESVALATRTAVTDATLLHARPRRVEELIWRPRFTPGVSMSRDSAREIQFRFLDGQLFRIVVLYDAYEIEGLTTQDVVSALSSVYGAPSDDRAGALARWQQGDSVLTLSEESYPSPYRLVLVSAALDRTARAAIVEATRLDRIEAPQKEAARRAAEAVQRRDDDAATRARSKAVFRP